LHNEELYVLYCSANIIWLLISKGGDGRGMWYQWRGERCMQDLAGKSERKRLLVRPRRRWEDNIEMDI